MDKIRRLFRKEPKSDCKYCQGLLGAGVRVPAAEIIFGTLAGCPACQLLHQCARLSDLSDPRFDLFSARFFGDAFIQYTFDPKSDATADQLCAEEGFQKGRWFGGAFPDSSPAYPPVERVVELFSPEGSTSYWPSIRPARPVAATADAPECLDLIKSWVTECDQKHRRCGNSQSSLLPDRVILVRGGGEPRLVETKPGTQGKYVALSHRWGGKVALTLKKAELASFKQSIPFSTFPRTFQDAITVCRALEVDYIWIDSICIIQDSKDDWDVQGAKMDQVYMNCLLTLAADTAENGEAGFLKTPKRAGFQDKTREIVYRGPKSQEGHAFVRPSREFGSVGGFGRHYDSWEHKDDQASASLKEQGSFLIKRGWVLQETLLPRRMLHFLPDEVTWRCISASRCECQLRPHERVVHAPLDLEEPREISIDDMKEYWKEIVEQYTRRQLTFYSDRLAALAGLASHAHKTKPEVEYFAGLWSDDLPSTLLWTVDRPVQARQPSSRIDPPVAPSWSWASVTGNVLFLFWKRNFDRGRWARGAPDITNVSATCEPAGKNKYGSVKDSKLTAEGYLCKVNLWLTRGSEWHFPFKMEAKRSDGTSLKTHGFFYPDTDEFLAEMQGKRVDGEPLTVVGIYESRMFIVLREVQGKDSVFERAGVLYLERPDAVDLAEWGRRERFTVV